MTILTKLTLQKQLSLMTGITLAGMLTVILFSLFNLGQLREEFGVHLSLQTMDKSLIEIKATALAISRADPILADTQARLEQTDKHILGLQKLVLDLTEDAALRERLSALSTSWEKYVQGFNGAIKIASSSPEDALQIPDAMYSMHLEPMVRDLDELVSSNQSAEVASRNKIEEDVNRILWLVLAPLLVVGILVTVFQTLFGLSLRKRLEAISREVDHLHQGDLRRRLPVTNNDEISHLARTINGFIARFEDILGDVHSSADQTQKTARGVTDMTHSVTTNAKNQSDKVFQVSSAMDEMGNTIKEVAANASRASAAAKETLILVRAGTDNGQRTIEALGKMDMTVSSSAVTMGELDAAIQRVSTVSNIIKDIAEQTNLLALNAAIEAARAGEHGRGFAVVADEVRKLSERTAASTSDIARIVQVIQSGTVQAKEAMMLAKEEVIHGVRYGENMGQLLEKIEKSVHIVTDMMQQIAAATEEQSVAGDNISRNIDSVASISASTASDIEHARNAMMNLSDISRALFTAVGQFKLARVA
jgi:methyl-accepting chemotaxis protein